MCFLFNELVHSLAVIPKVLVTNLADHFQNFPPQASLDIK
jgi:hypothetical protein